jgi:uncharacterized protein (DUF1800 family)
MASILPYNMPLGKRLAAHLLRRATFGPTKAMINSFALKTPSEALTELLNSSPYDASNKPIDPATNATWVDVLPTPATSVTGDVELRSYAIGWFLHNLRIDNTLRAKMTLFLHQNWISDSEAWQSQELYDQIKLLNFYALGSYKTLAKKMCRDNRMLVYLNGYQNTKTSPNENYAREFLELFTIGKGPQIAPGNYTNYTEDDIKETAKVLTGYYHQVSNSNVDTDTQIRYCNFNINNHTPGNKTFSTSTFNTTITGANPVTAASMLSELDQLVNMVFGKLETAKNIARKLYRYFVGRNITNEIETDIITPVAQTLYNNNYNLSLGVSQLLQSQHFYDLDDAVSTDNRIGGLMKSPLDCVYHVARFFDISPFNFTGNTPYTIWRDFYRDSIREALCKNADMWMYDPPTVAGYAGFYLAPKYDRNWFDASSITQRYYIGKCFTDGKRLPYSGSSLGAKIDIVLWVRNNISQPNDGNKVIDEICEFLFPEPLTPARRDYFLLEILCGNLSLTNWLNTWNAYLGPMGNYSGSDAMVRQRLELLFRALIYAHEYQVQ